MWFADFVPDYSTHRRTTDGAERTTANRIAEHTAKYRTSAYSNLLAGR